SYLSRLRKWPERHPDALIPARRAAIARFFGVDPSYFDPHCPVDQPPWLEFQPGHSPADALEQGGLTNGVAIPEDVARIYSRALSMSPQQRQIWLEMADFIDRMGTQTIVAAACT
ncbi:MAG: hypothetical protein JO100_05550, partial [Pseudonocardia sp.]|nr:hypothetical protein [Pseudonocardia sp.]